MLPCLFVIHIRLFLNDYLAELGVLEEGASTTAEAGGTAETQRRKVPQSDSARTSPGGAAAGRAGSGDEGEGGGGGEDRDEVDENEEDIPRFDDDDDDDDDDTISLSTLHEDDSEDGDGNGDGDGDGVSEAGEDGASRYSRSVSPCSPTTLPVCGVPRARL